MENTSQSVRKTLNPSFSLSPQATAYLLGRSSPLAASRGSTSINAPGAKPHDG